MTRKILAALLVLALLPLAAWAEAAPAGDAAPEAILWVTALDADGEVCASGTGAAVLDNRTLAIDARLLRGTKRLIAYNRRGDPYLIDHVFGLNEAAGVALLRFFSPTDLTPLPLESDGFPTLGDELTLLCAAEDEFSAAQVSLSGLFEQDGAFFLQARVADAANGGVLLGADGGLAGLLCGFADDGQARAVHARVLAEMAQADDLKLSVEAALPAHSGEALYEQDGLSVRITGGDVTMQGSYPAVRYTLWAKNSAERSVYVGITSAAADGEAVNCTANLGTLAPGEEKEGAALFFDFRGRTALTEAKELQFSLIISDPRDASTRYAESGPLRVEVPAAAPGSTPAASTAAPTSTPAAVPTPTPTVAPTPMPTVAPTPTPTVAPTPTPTVAPTPMPTVAPTPTPTVAPTPTPAGTPRAGAYPLLVEGGGLRLEITGVVVHPYLGSSMLLFYLDVTNNSGQTLDFTIENAVIDGVDMRGVGFFDALNGTTLKKQFSLHPLEGESTAPLYEPSRISFDLQIRDQDYDVLQTLPLTIRGPLEIEIIAPQPTPAPSYAALVRGDRGEEVRRMQRALISLGYLDDEADGIYGAQTARAVSDFREYNGLNGDSDVAEDYVLTLLYSGQAEPYPEPYFALEMPEPCYAEWTVERNDMLRIRVQVTNTSRKRTVKAFEIYMYATDVWGERIHGETTVYYDTTTRNVAPGKTVYCDYFNIPDYSQIDKIYAGISKIIYSDGTVREVYNVEYKNWTID